MRAIAVAGASLLASGAISVALVRRAPRRLRAANHRGDVVPVVLGLGVAGGAALGLAAVGLGMAAAGRAAGAVGSGPLAATGACALAVLAAGLADDLTAGGPRGLRSHLRALLAGHPTTGALKVLAALAAAAVAVAALPPRPFPERALGAVTMAGAANLWNGLDVAPGRAVKWLALAAVPVLAVEPDGPGGLLLAAVLGAAVAAGPLDLRERGMLGDAGANLIGFVLGAALYGALPAGGLVASAAAVVALNLAAETMTLTRLIGAVPPLRWLDALGTLPAGPPRHEVRRSPEA